MRGLTPTWAIWCNGNTPKLGWNRGGVRSTQKLQMLRTDRQLTGGQTDNLLSHDRALSRGNNVKSAHTGKGV